MKTSPPLLPRGGSALLALSKIVAGFVLLVVGGLLSLPGVPGPGIVLIVLGLMLLSGHFAWAKHALAWAREKAERLRETVAERR